MELIAALLHSPKVLFLDEPTIGLDVVAQHAIQEFLKEYQTQHETTILLTSHYMKDVAALCQRVVIIANGLIRYDGSLSGIVDRFSGSKIVTLQFTSDDLPDDLERYGEVLGIELPRVRIRVQRQKVAKMLASVLDRCSIEDVSVEDRPLEEVIAEFFSQVKQDDQGRSRCGRSVGSGGKMIDSLQLTKDLVAFESPSHVSNAAVSQFVVDQLKQLGFDIELGKYQDHAGVEKVNVLGRIGPSFQQCGQSGLAYFCHSDVVPADNWTGPGQAYSPVVQDEKLFGRGSCDMKGSAGLHVVGNFADRFDKAHRAAVLRLHRG